MFLTPRTAIVAAVAAVIAAMGGLATRTSIATIVIAADALVLAAALSDVLTAPPPASTKPVRGIAGVATTRVTTPVSVRLRNPLLRPLTVALRDASGPSLHRTPRVHRATIPAGGSIDVTAAITPDRRGKISLGPITVRTEGMLGLAGRQRTLDVAGEIKVYPPLPGRAQVSLRLERALTLQTGERSTAIRGGGGEFDSLREYHPDDEFRRINWHATARSSKAISNVFREERNQQVLLLLDAGRMMAGTIEGTSRFEWGIDAAIALAELAARIGDHAGMAAFDRDIRALIPPRSGRSHPARMLDALFTLQPSLDAPNYTHVFATLLSRWRRRSLLILITEITDEAAMEPLIKALPVLLRRHIVIAGAVSDPSTIAAALSIPSSSEGAYLKAAAARTLDAREKAAARLRALGAVVVDQPPGHLSGALADQYLRIKASGRL